MNAEGWGLLYIDVFTKINGSAFRIKKGIMGVEHHKTIDIKTIRFPRT